AEFTGRIEDGVLIAPEVGATAPDIKGATPYGDRLDLAAWRGQPVIVNFWATWCAPCRIEMPGLETLYRAYGPERLRVIGVNTGEDIEDVLDWIENHQLTFPMVLDPDGQIASSYMLRGQPTTFVIQPDGAISHVFYGPVTRHQLEDILRPYLIEYGVPHVDG